MGPLLPPFLSFASGIALGGPLGFGYAASTGALLLSLLLVVFFYFQKYRFSPIALIPLFFSRGTRYAVQY